MDGGNLRLIGVTYTIYDHFCALRSAQNYCLQL
jgi:hypothetical protein